MSEGPKLTLNMSCHGCRFVEDEEYNAQSDWGFKYYCTHGGERKRIGYSDSRTPDWCPLAEPVVILPKALVEDICAYIAARSDEDDCFEAFALKEEITAAMEKNDG